MLRDTLRSARRVAGTWTATAFLATTLAPLPRDACAAEVPVYQVTVPFPASGETERQAAFAEALRAVVVRASGRRSAADTVAGVDPQRLVQQYAATTDRRLKVGFDPRGVEELLAKAGLPWWAAERPQTVVMLAGEPAGAQGEAERIAALRGLPVAITGAPADSARIAAAVAAGNVGEVLRRAGVAGNGAALLAPAVAGGGQWAFAHADQLVRGSGGLADGVHLAADTLAARYAPASTRATTSLSVAIAGIDRFEAYADALAYLRGLSLVRSVAVDELDGDVLRLRLGLRGDLELLRRYAALDDRLLPPPAGRSGVDFLYPP